MPLRPEPTSSPLRLPPPRARSVLCSWHGTVMAPEGTSFRLGDALVAATPLTLPPSGAAGTVEVAAFNVEYYPDGAVRQVWRPLLQPGVWGAELGWGD